MAEKIRDALSFGVKKRSCKETIMAKKDYIEVATGKEKINNLEKVVFGNGQDGLLKRVDAVENAKQVEI